MILGRYVAGRFLSALALFALGMTALIVLADLAIRVKDLLASAEDSFLLFVVKYYGLKTPFLLTMILPASILFAAVFTLMRLSKANEIVPMLVGGVSLRRLCLPFVWIAAAATLVTGWIHWTLLPRTWRTLAALEDRVRGEEVGRSVLGIDHDGNHLTAAEFQREERILKDVILSVSNQSGETEREVVCARGVCERWRERSDTAHWRFFEGRVYPLEGGRRKLEFGPDGSARQVAEEIPPEGLLIELGVTPVDLLWKNRFGEHLSFRESLRLVRRHPDAPQYRIQLYGKFTEPLTPLLLLFLGLPFALRAVSARNVFVGLGLCLAVIVGFFGVRLLLAQMGAQGALPPMAVTLVPTALFALAGGILFARVQT